MSDKEHEGDKVRIEVSEKTFRSLDALRRGGEELDGMLLRLAKAAKTSGVFAQAKKATSREEAP